MKHSEGSAKAWLGNFENVLFEAGKKATHDGMFFGPYMYDTTYIIVKPGSHMSPMVGDLLSVVIRGENLQRILHISNH